MSAIDRARSPVRAALIVATLVVSTGTLRAQPRPRVVVLDTGAGISLTALTAQLNLHVHADVTINASSNIVDGIASRFATAAAVVDRERAAIVVWIDPIPSAAGGQGFVAYAVGRWPDRAVIELVRIDATTPNDQVERIVALKLAGLLDRVVLEDRAIGLLDGSPDPPTKTRAITPPPSPPAVHVALGGVVAAGGGRGTVAGIVGSVGRSFVRSPVDLGFDVQLRWLSTAIVGSERVAIGDATANIGLVACRGSSVVRPCAAVRGGASVVRATVSTSDGRDGDQYVILPSVWLGVGLGVRLSGPVRAVVEVGYEPSLLRQRFLVDGMVAADLGSGRVVVAATLSVALP